MDLIFRELQNEGFQKIKMLENCNLIYIRPHILKVGSPGGQLKLQVRDSFGFLIDESAPINISSIGTLANAHGYLRFDVTTPLRKGETYEIGVLAFNGYTYSAGAYVGLCRDFDLRKVKANFNPNDAFDSAFDFELWERKMSDRSAEFFDGFESALAPTSITDTQANLDNNVGPLDVEDLIFSSSEVRSAQIHYTIKRRTDSNEKRSTGILKVQYKPDAGAWSIANESDFDNDTGVAFTITAAGQIQYTTNDLSGANYDGFIIFKTISAFTVGV